MKKLIFLTIICTVLLSFSTAQAAILNADLELSQTALTMENNLLEEFTCKHYLVCLLRYLLA